MVTPEGYTVERLGETTPMLNSAEGNLVCKLILILFIIQRAKIDSVCENKRTKLARGCVDNIV